MVGKKRIERTTKEKTRERAEAAAQVIYESAIGARSAIAASHKLSTRVMGLVPIVPQPVAGVYVVGGVDRYVKIGWSSNIRKRICQMQISFPFELKLLAILSEDPADEVVYHNLFENNHVRGEWYIATKNLVSVIKRARDQVPVRREELPQAAE